MNYKMLSHSYINTGGHCMVSVFTIYDLDERRTLFVMVNEEGGSLATADYITEEIDFEDVTIVDNFQTDNLTAVDKNYELYRYCIIEYAKKDFKDSGCKAHLPYHLLSDELQQQLTPHYIAWHKEEIGDNFATDGFNIIMESGYEPPVKQHHMKADVYEAITSLRAAFFKMNEVFSDDHYMTWLSDKYPFDRCFTELTHDVSDWCEDMVEGVIVD